MIKPKLEVEYKDKGLAELVAQLREIREQKPYVKVGVIGRDAATNHNGDLSNVQLATIHEFGAPSKNIPERSFIRATFEAKRHEYISKLEKLVKTTVYSGKRTFFEALELLGLKMASDVKNHFTDGSNGWPPNAPETIKAKGSSKPLIDTGALRASISHEVVKNGTNEEGH